MLERTYPNQICSIARTLEVVGERWTLLVLRDALFGLRRFDESDVDNLVAWQKKSGIKIDLAFNGGGSDDAGTGDPLTSRVVADKAQLQDAKAVCGIQQCQHTTT